MNAEESRELTQFKSYLGAELSDNINAAQRHFPSFKQNWPISPGASPRSTRDRPPCLRRSKSSGQGTSYLRLFADHLFLLIKILKLLRP